MKVSFLTSGHFPFDDRIFYHQGRSLYENGNDVEIVSSKINLKEVADGLKLNCFEGDTLSKKDKISRFRNCLGNFSPDIIICSEPLTVLAAKQYSKNQPRKIRIVYDITEWYPSRKNLTGNEKPFRWITFLKLFFFNLYSSSLADAFLFGEWYKRKPYRFLFPFKPYKIISYYPDLQYIHKTEPGIVDGKLRLSYSGKMSIEKGFGNFCRVLSLLSESDNNLNIEVRIIGWYENSADKEACEKLFRAKKENISFSFSGRQPFIDFLESVNYSDIFLDLREDNFENQHCLPIKLFYYAAMGRPVIYTDLKAIRKEVEINNFGFLVKPESADQIVNIILGYLNDRELYRTHCKNARLIAENIYNWQKIKPGFLMFISSLSS
jgi:glycosyltransferase involved in cell wall biosynthesis